MPIFEMNLPEINKERKIERSVKNILALKNSLNEAYNYSFVGEDQLKKLNIDFINYLKLVNPLSGIANLLRQSLVPGLVSNIKSNQFKSDSFGFFEIGSVFFKTMGDLKKDNTEGNFLPYQEKKLGIVLTGDDDLLGRLKGIIDSLFKNLLNKQVEAEFLVLEDAPAWADKNSSAKVLLFGQELGTIALLSAESKDNINLKKEVALAELNFNKLVELVLDQAPFRFMEAPKYPPIIRDLAFVVNEKILYNDLRKEILNFNPLIKTVELFDVYVGNKLAADEKSLAFHINYLSDERTLKSEEIDNLQNDLITHLAEVFEAKLRDF